MAKKKEESASDGIEIIEGGLSKSEKFIEGNQKILSIILIGIIAIVGIYLAVNKFYFEPMENEVQEQTWAAERYFEKDSFDLALNGDGNYLGFIDIIDEYGSTNAGNLANYYAGVCYLNLGDNETAIEYLDGFSSDDKMVQTMAISSLGDAYCNLEDYDVALTHYLRAASNNPNDLTSPAIYMKAADLYEVMGDYVKALEIYDKIKSEFPDSKEGQATFIQKYITRATLKGNS